MPTASCLDPTSSGLEINVANSKTTNILSRHTILKGHQPHSIATTKTSNLSPLLLFLVSPSFLVVPVPVLTPVILFASLLVLWLCVQLFMAARQQILTSIQSRPSSQSLHRTLLSIRRLSGIGNPHQRSALLRLRAGLGNLKLANPRHLFGGAFCSRIILALESWQTAFVTTLVLELLNDIEEALTLDDLGQVTFRL